MKMAEDIKRTYTIPLRRGFCNTPRYKRTNKAVKVLTEFLKRHMKSENIKLGKNLNEFIWKNGIKNPPCKVRVDVVKNSEGVVRVELIGKAYTDFKMQDKTDRNQSLKEKLQGKVKGTDEKAEVKKEEPKVKATPSATAKTEAPKAAAKPKATPAPKVVEKAASSEKAPVEKATPAPKVEVKETPKPKVKEAPKVETKAEPVVKTEAKTVEKKTE